MTRVGRDGTPEGVLGKYTDIRTPNDLESAITHNVSQGRPYTLNNIQMVSLKLDIDWLDLICQRHNFIWSADMGFDGYIIVQDERHVNDTPTCALVPQCPDAIKPETVQKDPAEKDPIASITFSQPITGCKVLLKPLAERERFEEIILIRCKAYGSANMSLTYLDTIYKNLFDFLLFCSSHDLYIEMPGKGDPELRILTVVSKVKEWEVIKVEGEWVKDATDAHKC